MLKFFLTGIGDAVQGSEEAPLTGIYGIFRAAYGWRRVSDALASIITAFLHVSAPHKATVRRRVVDEYRERW